jgi:hypothetical protein
MITSTIETITPAIAAEYLKSNTGNRPVNSRMVQKYKQEMVQGKWMVSNQAIGFDRNGRLTDGQHRLHACVAAATPFTTIVIRGLEPEVFTVIDTHAARTGGQVAKIAGVTNAAGCVAVITSHLLYEASAGKTSVSHALIGNVSARAKLEMIEADPERVQRSYAIARRAWDQCGVIIPSLLGGLHYTVSKTMPDAADAFVEAIGSGENMKQGDPRMTLRNRLIDRRAKVHKERIEWLLVLHAYAWNAFVEGRSIKKLLYRAGDSVPKLIR